MSQWMSHSTKHRTHKYTHRNVHVSNISQATSTNMSATSTSANTQATSFLNWVHMADHVGKGRNPKMADVALPVQILPAWRPRALHVPLCGCFGRPCFMWHHIKTCWNWPCFLCLMGVFCMSIITDFRWRLTGVHPCQSERLRPFFLTSKKTLFSYSAWH